MNEQNHLPTEHDFDARLRRARSVNGIHEDGRKDSSEIKGKGLAFRIGTELVVAVLVGGSVGYLLDNVLDTKPWCLIIFLLLGNTAGLWNIFRLINRQGHSVGFKK